MGAPSMSSQSPILYSPSSSSNYRISNSSSKSMTSSSWKASPSSSDRKVVNLSVSDVKELVKTEFHIVKNLIDQKNAATERKINAHQAALEDDKNMRIAEAKELEARQKKLEARENKLNAEADQIAALERAKQNDQNAKQHRINAAQHRQNAAQHRINALQHLHNAGEGRDSLREDLAKAKNVAEEASDLAAAALRQMAEIERLLAIDAGSPKLS